MEYGTYALKLTVARCANGETREVRFEAYPEDTHGPPIALGTLWTSDDPAEAVRRALGLDKGTWMSEVL